MTQPKQQQNSPSMRGKKSVPHVQGEIVDGPPMIYDPSKGINAFNADKAEKILIAMSYNEAARQISSGTASASTINHFLKLGSVREEVERLKLQNEIALSKAKVKQLAETAESAADSKRAIEAFKSYAPSND